MSSTKRFKAIKTSLAILIAVAVVSMGLISAFTEYSPLVAEAGTTYEYGYTGGCQTFTAPETGTYTIELWGAQGGTPTYSTSVDYRTGGYGGYVSAEVFLNKGTTFYVYVGQAGRDCTGGNNKTGSYNGGGVTSENSNTISWGASGGGATDIRLSNAGDTHAEALKTRLMVVGGGGAGNARGDGYGCGNGGVGGNLTGGTGSAGWNTNNYTSYSYGSGGTQTSAGTRYFCSYPHSTGAGHNVTGSEISGSFGVGGTEQSGGGGGYYGGAGASHGAAGGGSSYINGYSGCDTTYYNSKYVFSSCTFQAGVRSGNGYAKITFTCAMTASGNEITSYGGYYYDIPEDGVYILELWGAEGATANAKAGYGSYAGGLGGYTKAEVTLTKGTRLFCYVGEAGKGGYTSATFNGGGAGTNEHGWGGSGGGATDIRIDGVGLTDRVMVAGGGGAGSNRGDGYGDGYGGAGGGLVGGTGTSINHGQTNNTYNYNVGSGGQQTKGGSSHNFLYTNNALNSTSVTGGFGYGGGGQCAGGGGWYGGGSAGHGGAGGGSSYISGFDGCDSHYTKSKYSFTQCIMQQGVWKGNGKIKITLKESAKDTGNCYFFGYTGGQQTFVVPTSGYYTLELQGAEGGTASGYSGHGSWAGGKGGYTKGTTYLTKGTKLYIYVGGRGVDTHGSGGYNGGGNGTDANTYGATGGGATDIRVGGTALSNRIIVSGGGGAGNNRGDGYGNGYGGAGGGLQGGSGTTQDNTNTGHGYPYSYGGGGGQTSGGVKYYINYSDGSLDRTEVDGSLGQGGSDQSGGGGGYYGGASGNHGAAGGGSSYINGYEGCDTTYYNENYVFTNCEIVQGFRTGSGICRIYFDDQHDSANDATFEYTGAVQTYTVPATGIYSIRVWGAQGGTASYSGSFEGGKGGFTYADVELTKGTVLYIYVGGKGGAGNTKGGWNGGGDSVNASYAASGGGASDIRLVGGEWDSEASLKSRIIVAGGGGGANDRGVPANDGVYYGSGRGGAGGGLIGGTGESINYNVGNHYSSHGYGTGGTQKVGGDRLHFNSDTGAIIDQYTIREVGSFGIGSTGESGGGGGYYGGGHADHGGAGGGSSYANGWTGCDTTYYNPDYVCKNVQINQGAKSGNGRVQIVFNSETEAEGGYDVGFSGATEKYTIKVSGIYRISLWGAQGGDAVKNGYKFIGGYGGYTAASIYLEAGTEVYFYIGGKGSQSDQGGWNGGGSLQSGQSLYGASGGGASDIRIGGTALTDRLMVAGGGGGANCRGVPDTDNVYYGGGNGGQGGGLVGGSGISDRFQLDNHYSDHGYGTGGGQTAGGASLSFDSYTYALKGTTELGTKAFGQGGGSEIITGVQSGGGGGWYGGGSAGHGGAGGGSSYINGYTGCDTTYYNSKYKFFDCEMLQGVRTGNGGGYIELLSEDLSAPSKATLSYTSASYYYNAVTVSFSGSTDGTNQSGFDHYEYSVGNRDGFKKGTSCSVSSDASSGIQNVILYVRAFDKNGNYSEVNHTFVFDRNNYAITYNLGENGSNNSGNPATYNYETSTISLGTPTRAGFTFGGWYSDSGYSTASSTIAVNSQGAKTFYAKWTINALGKPSKSSDVSKTYDTESSTLTVTPSHDAVTKEFSYQWYKGETAISGATSASYNVTAVADSGSYKCKVTVTSDGQSSTATSDAISVSITRATSTINTDGVTKSYTYTASLQTISSGATLNHSETTLVYSNNTFTTVAEGDGKKVKISSVQTANYNSAEVEVQISVAKADVSFSSLSASGIVYGQTLASSVVSGNAYNASSTSVAVAGSYSWVSPTTTPAVSDSNATEYDAQFTVTDTANYNVPDTFKLKLAVAKADVSFAFTSATGIVYGQTLASSTIAGTAYNTSNTTMSVSGSYSWVSSGTAPSVSDSDTTEYDVSFTPTDTANYNTPASTVKGKLTIAKADVVATVSGASGIVYGQTLASSTSISGTAYNSTVSTIDVDGTFTWVTSTIAPSVADSNVTEYDVLFTPSDTANYNTANTKGKLAITKAEVTCVFTSATSIKYGQTLAESTISGSGSNATVSTISVEGTFTWVVDSTVPAVADSDLTEYDVQFVPSDSANYEVTPVAVKGKLTVEKADIQVSGVIGTNITYGDKVGNSALSGVAKSKVTNEDVGGTFAFADGEAVPTVDDSEFGVVFTPTDSANYNSANGTATLTVDKRVLTIDDGFTAKSKDFDNTKEISFTITVSNIYGSESLTVTISQMTSDVKAGDYNMTATEADCTISGDTSKNYEMGEFDRDYTFTINKVKYTFLANLDGKGSKTYGDDDEDNFYQSDDLGIDGYESVRIDFTREEGEDVGFYKINACTFNDSGVYDNFDLELSSTEVKFEITKRDVKVVGLVGKDRMYDGTDVVELVLTDATISNTAFDDLKDGLIGFTENGGTITSADASDDAYTITLGEIALTGEKKGNYNLLAVDYDVTVNITPYIVDVEYTNVTGKVYNTEEQSITVNFKSGTTLFNSDSPEISIVYKQGESDVSLKKAGDYTAYASLDDGNYAISDATKTQAVTIARKSIASDVSITINSGNAYVYDGNKVEPDGSDTAFGFASDVGEYGVDYSAKTFGENVNVVGDNYVIFQGVGNYDGELKVDFQIAELEIEIVFEGYENLVYNGAVRSISAKAKNESDIKSQGGVKDVVNFTLEYDKEVKDVGSYSATAGVDNTNYALIGTITQEFDIGQKDIADDDVVISGIEASYTYTGSQILPEYTVSLGDVETLAENTDFTSVLGTNTLVSDEGSVTLSGIGNYKGTKNVTFQITKKTITIANVTATNRAYDGTKVVALTGGELQGVAESDKTYVTFDLGEGTIPYKEQNENATVGYTVSTSITLGGEKSANYELTQPGYVRVYISRINVTVKGITAVDRVYDSGNTTVSLEYTTLSYEGLIDGDDVTALASSIGTGIADGDAKGVHSVTLAISLTGEDAKNYTPVQEAIEVEILAKGITIELVKATSREYDGTTEVELYGGKLKGVSLLDNKVSFTLGKGTISSKDSGEYEVTTSIQIKGERSENYTLTQPDYVSVEITQRTINDFSLKATDRVYEKDNYSVDVVAYDIKGLVGDESIEITVVGTIASDYHVGDSKEVEVTSHAIVSNAYSKNYKLGTQIPEETTVNITQKHIGITGLTATERGVSSSKEVELKTSADSAFTSVCSGDEINVSGAIVGYLAEAVSDAMVHETNAKVVDAIVPIDNADYIVDFSLIGYEIKVVIHGSRLLTLKYAGGTKGGNEEEVVYVPYDTAISAGVLPTNLERKGYTQKSSWLIGSESGTPFDIRTKLLSDITLYATWTANTYKAYYKGANGTELIGTAVYDRTFSLRTTTKTNYIFTGWSSGGVNYTNEDGECSDVWSFDSDMVFTPSFKAMEITAPFNATKLGDNAYSIVYGDNTTFLAKGEKGFSFTLAYTKADGTRYTASHFVVGEYKVKVIYTMDKNTSIKHEGVVDLTIVPRTVTLKKLGASVSKSYDDTDTVETGMECGIHYDFENLVYGDTLSLIYTAKFNSKDVITANAVNVSYTGLIGENAQNYTIESGVMDLQGFILKARTEVTFESSEEREYNGKAQVITARATAKGDDVVDVNVVTLGGKEPEEIGEYTVKAVITDTNYVITGTETFTFRIVPKVLKVSVPGIYKRYDGTTSVTVTDFKLDGVIDGDDVIMTDLVAEYTSSECGSNIPVIVTWEIIGKDIANYEISKETYMGSIHPVELTDSSDISESGTKNVYIKVDGYIDADANLSVHKVEESDKISAYAGEVKNDIGVKGDALLVVETELTTTVNGDYTYCLYLGNVALSDSSQVYVKIDGQLRTAPYTVEGDYIVVNSPDNISAIVLYEPKKTNYNWIAIAGAVVAVTILILFITQRKKGGDYR